MSQFRDTYALCIFSLTTTCATEGGQSVAGSNWFAVRVGGVRVGPVAVLCGCEVMVDCHVRGPWERLLDVVFEEAPDLKKMVYVAQLACIHEEIMQMPMQYHSLVGDMGSSLSGGQKQRLLLARALYQEPDILFLDEASSHLDMENEAQINHHLKSLNMTRIIVAHRPQSIAMADKVYRLENGNLHLCPPTEVTGSATSGKHGETL